MDVNPQTVALYHAMSNDRADLYAEQVLTPSMKRSLKLRTASLDAISDELADPVSCLAALYGVYAFSRRGKERADFADIAVQALRDVAGNGVDSMRSEDFHVRVWNRFTAICERRGRNPMEKLNFGAISGLAELSASIYNETGQSVASWIGTAIATNHRIENEFFRMVDVRGVGPKAASQFLRDVVVLFGLENDLEHVDRYFLIPVDKWMRRIAPLAIDEPDSDDPADWILAGKIAKFARKSGVSPARFSMGVTYFGMREVRNPERFLYCAEVVSRRGIFLR